MIDFGRIFGPLVGWECCEFCLFSVGCSSYGRSACHRHSPIPGTETDEYGRLKPEWPYVPDEQLCGDYKRDNKRIAASLADHYGMGVHRHFNWLGLLLFFATEPNQFPRLNWLGRLVYGVKKETE